MVKCSAPLCSNATYKKTAEISFHRFPKDENIKLAWLSNIKRPDWQPTSASVLCSKHFEASLIDKSGFRTVLAPGAIPTIFDLVQDIMPTSTITNEGQILREIQNIQHGVSSTVPNYDEDNHRKEEEIRKMKYKAVLKNKKDKSTETTE
ncbi:unnamed protein product, partial [Iphiclides podalirius]